MTAAPENELLGWLSPDDYARLNGQSRRVELEQGLILYEAGDEVDSIWFPETGLISVISVMLSGASVETAVIGQEGGIGYIEASGAGVMFSRCIIQVPGRFMRTPAQIYRDAFDDSHSLRVAIQSHAELLIAEARQTIGCLALHKTEQRLAWWLLECQDRLGGRAELPLTQEFLATMLGAQRTTVTEVAQRLQETGAIRYRRGRIEIVDRSILEGRSCECYATNQGFRRQIERRINLQPGLKIAG